MSAKYPGHVVKHTLADGTEVLWNRIQGYSVESVDSMCLRPLNKREAAEVAQIEADDDKRFADECEREKVASEQQTGMW